LDDEDPALVRAVVEKTYGYPKALQFVVGILANDGFVSLEVLLQNTELFQKDVLEKFIHEAQFRLDSDARHVMQALAIYGSHICEEAILFLLELYARGFDVSTVLRRLTRRHYITVMQKRGEIMMHQLDRDANYRQIPTNGTSTYNVKVLESRAADYYAQLRTPPETWRSATELVPRLKEIDHRIMASDYNAAAHTLLEIDPRILSWGAYRQVMDYHERLIDKITDMMLKLGSIVNLGTAYQNQTQHQKSIVCYSQH